MFDRDKDAEQNDRAALSAAVASTLARGGVVLSFPPILRARHDRDRLPARVAELRRLGTIGAVVYGVIVFLLHMFVIAHANPWAGAAQYILLPALMILLVRIYDRPNVPIAKIETALVCACCAVVLGAVLDIATGPTDVVVMNMFLIVAPVLGCMFFTRMTLGQASFFAVFSLSCLAGSIFARNDIAANIRFYPLAALASSSLFALFAVRELDGALRRLYLLGLAQTLRIEDLAAENQSLDQLSTTDSLTGARNRRHFEMSLAKLEPPSTGAHFLLLIDLDYFKQLNDRHGHQAGDACLRSTAALMSAAIRPDDVFARVGGDEFAILLKNCPLLDARRIADRICAGVPDQGFEVDGRWHSVSVTIGGAPWAPDREAAQLYALADAALYQAKRAGRGRVVWAQSGDDPRMNPSTPANSDIRAA